MNIIHLQDPIAHTTTTLIPLNKRAMVMHLPELKTPTPEQVAAEASLAASYKLTPSQTAHYELKRGIEKLPQRTIAGLYAEGRRETTVIPVGQMGNDREIRVVSESWTSPELNLLLEYTSDDPRIGKTSKIVSDVQRTEPDAVLFQMPSDYQVVDQKTRGQR